MLNFLEQINACLPLYFEEISYDGDSLIITGTKWQFSSNSAWRVTGEEKLLFTCWDDDSVHLIESFLGVSVINVKWLLDKPKIDLSFFYLTARNSMYFVLSLASLG